MTLRNDRKLYLKTNNQTLILQEIKDKGQISRAQISKALGISAPSVSKNIDYFLTKGIIKETGMGVSSGGRKPVVLEYNYEYCYIIAMTLDENELKAKLTNLNGDSVVEFLVIKGFQKLSLQEISDEIIYLVNTITKESKIQLDLIKCISIVIPGIIKEEKVLVSNIFPELEGKGLHQAIKEEFKIDVLIKNDINSKVLGEFWRLPKDFKNVVYISPEITGVGSGIILDGELYEGSSFAAGEIGYMVFEEYCDENGGKALEYLERIVSRKNITKILKGNDLTETNKITGGLLNKNELVDFNKLKNAAEQGDKVSIDIYNFLARYYAMAIQNISTMLNPDIIILGGNFIKLGNLLLDLIRRNLSDLELLPIKLSLGKKDFDIKMHGAIYFGLNYVESKIFSV